MKKIKSLKIIPLLASAMMLSTPLIGNFTVFSNAAKEQTVSAYGGGAIQSSSWKTTDFETVGYINYVPLYGIAVYKLPGGDLTGQYLRHGTSWEIFQKSVNTQGETYYNVGKNQWIKADYVLFTPIDQIEKLSGVVTIKHVPGYGVNFWRGPNTGSYYKGRKLMNGTRWRTFGKQNGFYKIGTDQWVQGEFASFKAD